MSDTVTVVPLLTFTSGNRIFRYAESAVNIELTEDGIVNIYERLSLKVGTLKSRTRITQSDALILTLPESAAISQLIIRKELTERIRFSLRYVDVSLTGSLTLRTIEFRGNVVAFTLTGSKIKVEIEGIAQELQAIGLRRKYATTCPHALYDESCKVSKTDHSQNANVSYTHGRTALGGGYIVLVGATMVNNRFDGGTAIITLNGIKVNLRIAHNDTTTLFVDYLPDNLPLAPEQFPPITMLEGCDLTFNTCVNKFLNFKRFGGFPYFRTEGVNPFDSDGFAEIAAPRSFKPIDHTLLD